MKSFFSSLCLLLLLLQGCQAPSASKPVERDNAKREALFSSVAALTGRWQVLGDDEPSFIEFDVSSAGSLVREIMFPGTEYEMTNMYTLDGNALVMTHYCAGGNQPHMSASAIEGKQLVFASYGVSDLETPETSYMAEMTISFVDEDHVNETWIGMAAGEQSEMPVFKLERVK